jgi:hypothetical protein
MARKNPVPPPGHVSVPEAITQLGISRQRGYQLVRMGILPSVTIDGRVWVPQEAVNLRLAGESRLSSSQCVSTQEAADFFGVDLSTIHHWRKVGYLKATKVSNKLCFDINQIISFVPPRNSSVVGRYPARPGTRTLRGRYFPVPQPTTDERNQISDDD